MNYTVKTSPHIRGKDTTARLMEDVVDALLPTITAGTVFFGLRALAVTAVCAAGALAGEAVFRLTAGRPQTLHDRSAAVTGLLLAMTLPASIPYWLAGAGGFLSTFLFKGLCGGLGQNAFNPALAARALLLLLWPVHLTRYPPAGTRLPLFGAVDAVSSATPLHEMQMPALPHVSLWDMFVGNVGGCIGEVSSLALLLGGAYLLARRVIRPHIPLAYVGTAALLTFLFSRGQPPLLWMAYNLLGGGILLGAFFMATDYATAPVTPKGQLLYGAGCGALTVLFRYTGLFPEGFTYAILFMNAAAWTIDRLTPPRRFGTQKGAAP